jgi:hypothetical protein
LEPGKIFNTVLRIILPLAVCPANAFSAESVITPQVDYALITYDQHVATPAGSDILTSANESFPAFYGFCGIPTPRIAQRLTVFAVEANVVVHTLMLNTEKINNPVLQRYGIFFGGELLNRKIHELYLFALAGAATDFENPGRDALYFQPIIDWHINVMNGLTIGVGAQFSYNFDRWTRPFGLPFAPLLTVIWQAGPKTTVRFSWDNLLLRQYIGRRVCAAAEVKYFIRWFRLDDNWTYEFENITAGAGPDIRIADDIYLRLRGFCNLTARETILHGNDIIETADSRRGWGVRAAVAYSK